jgi:hypothetical protein
MPTSIRLRGVSGEFKSMDKEVVTFVNKANRLQAFETLTEIKRKTPVDTGRAKNSWVLTNNKNEFKDAQRDGTRFSSPIIGPVSDRRIETLYLTNGTPYIEDLNRGSSRQAPARFIEKAVLGKNYSASGVLFETIKVEE